MLLAKVAKDALTDEAMPQGKMQDQLRPFGAEMIGPDPSPPPSESRQSIRRRRVYLERVLKR